MFIGLPAILANLATPVAAVYVTRIISDFGEAAVAATAIVDRVVPVLFGVIFALTGSIGPIIGQNLGAGLMAACVGLSPIRLCFRSVTFCAWAVLFVAVR